MKDFEQYLPSLPVKPGINTLPANVAMRYLRINSSKKVEIEKVSVAASTYPTVYRGAFACSDELLNKIWMHSAYTLRLCMREFLLDGIKRDRLPWVGDLYLGILCNYFSFAEKEVIQRTLTALYGDEPQSVDFNGAIDYSLWWVISLLEYVLAFGDVAYLERVQEKFH